MTDEEFTYKIVNTNKSVVVSFEGRIGQVAAGKLETCHQEIIPIEANHFIFNFKNVDKVDQTSFRILTLMQKSIRDKKASVWIMGLTPLLKDYLNERGVIRLNETIKSLNDLAK